MKILAIETSCDETAIAVLEAHGELDSPRFKVLGNALLSQVKEHQKYGGVYPNLAKRLHAQNLIPILKIALTEAKLLKKSDENKAKHHSNVRANVRMMLEREPELFEQFAALIPSIQKPDIDTIAVTQGPGLEPALWVGLNFAKALSVVWDIPLVPINHMEGHIASVLLDNRNISFPALSLLVSGGHTELVLVKNWGEYKTIGQTRDDAVGEAFDKVARMLSLPYPGGPEISNLAERSRKKGAETELTLPRPMLHSKDFDFSFSGIKTAVLYTIQKLDSVTDEKRETIAREFEDAVVEVLVAKTHRALEEYGTQTLIVGGGVAANNYLRAQMTIIAEKLNVELLIPSHELSTDNAIMIGMAGYIRYLKGRKDSSAQNIQLHAIKADGNLTFAEYAE